MYEIRHTDPKFYRNITWGVTAGDFYPSAQGCCPPLTARGWQWAICKSPRLALYLLRFWSQKVEPCLLNVIRDPQTGCVSLTARAHYRRRRPPRGAALANGNSVCTVWTPELEWQMKIKKETQNKCAFYNSTSTSRSSRKVRIYTLR